MFMDGLEKLNQFRKQMKDKMNVCLLRRVNNKQLYSLLLDSELYRGLQITRKCIEKYYYGRNMKLQAEIHVDEI